MFGPVSDTRAKLDFAAIWHSTGNMAEIHEQKWRSIFAKSKLEISKICVAFLQSPSWKSNLRRWIFAKSKLEMSKICIDFLQSPSWKSNLRWIFAKSKLEILGVGALVRRPSIFIE